MEKVSFETEINDLKIEKVLINSGTTIIWGDERNLLINNLKELNSDTIFIEIVKKGYYLEKESNSNFLILKDGSRSYIFTINKNE